jgi:two-component system, cell cycle sensor histidine kinase and response regulator CckA
MADGQVLSDSRVVLVVDDEPSVLGMMARALHDVGYAVHAASNGPDALALAEDLPRPPDLVVTDILMEPMGGTELAERLFSGGLALRFLFVSGYGPAADYNESFGPFLPKPFLPGRLVEEVTHLIG